MKDCDLSDSTVAVKISGDGAQFSKTSKFLLLTFSLPFLASDALSGSGKLSHTHTHTHTHIHHTILTIIMLYEAIRLQLLRQMRAML